MEGWHIAPAWASYQCYTIWITKTRAACICNTVTWFPHISACQLPTLSITSWLASPTSCGTTDTKVQQPACTIKQQPHQKATPRNDILHATVPMDPDSPRVATKKVIDGPMDTKSLRVATQTDNAISHSPPPKPADLPIMLTRIHPNRQPKHHQRSTASTYHPLPACTILAPMHQTSYYAKTAHLMITM